DRPHDRTEPEHEPGRVQRVRGAPGDEQHEKRGEWKEEEADAEPGDEAERHEGSRCGPCSEPPPTARCSRSSANDDGGRNEYNRIEERHQVSARRATRADCGGTAAPSRREM